MAVKARELGVMGWVRPTGEIHCEGAPDAVDVLALTTPEIAGSRTVIRTAWPPGLAVLGTLPLLAARAAARPGIPCTPPPGNADALPMYSPRSDVA